MAHELGLLVVPLLIVARRDLARAAVVAVLDHHGHLALTRVRVAGPPELGVEPLNLPEHGSSTGSADLQTGRFQVRTAVTSSLASRRPLEARGSDATELAELSSEHTDSRLDRADIGRPRDWRSTSAAPAMLLPVYSTRWLLPLYSTLSAGASMRGGSGSRSAVTPADWGRLRPADSGRMRPRAAAGGCIDADAGRRSMTASPAAARTAL